MPYLKINQIQAGMININLVARVANCIELGNGKYKIILEEGTSKVSMIYSRQILKNSLIRIEKAFAYKYKGELSIALTKKGKLILLDFNST